MMHDDEEATYLQTSPRWKKNFGPNLKFIKFLGLGVKTGVGRVSGNNKIFLGLITQ